MCISVSVDTKAKVQTYIDYRIVESLVSRKCILKAKIIRDLS